ncbi:hypothetical protein, partial [Porticoccus hydrocarbonoclasticus]|uniref:hypothetical protein n=1 Tax=Porticoccus hydrocarbonoclasticus TaxID=1073414 RepID=UPI002352E658
LLFGGITFRYNYSASVFQALMLVLHRWREYLACEQGMCSNIVVFNSNFFEPGVPFFQSV